MSGPPKNVEPSALWVKLTERPRPMKFIDFPSKGGSPGKLALRILTESELHVCRANATNTAKELLGGESRSGDMGYEDIYRNELAVQLVTVGCRAAEYPDGMIPAFPSAKDARKKLTSDEFAVLAMAYKAFQVESGPILSELTKDEMEAWIKLLQEGGSRVPLAHLSGEAQTDLIMFLVSMLPTSQTASGSAGLQLEGSPLESERPTPKSELVDADERS